MIKQYITSLEQVTTEEVSNVLQNKIDTVGIERTVDYVGYSIDNLQDKIKRIDEAINELRQVKEAVKDQIETVKIGTSKWLSDNGIDKLQGDQVSSITVADKKETIEVVVDDEEAVINAGFFKMAVDKTALKNALIEGVHIDGAHIEITHNEQTIRINKKRLKKDENIEPI